MMFSFLSEVNDVNIVDVWDWYVVSILSNEETFKILHKEIENKDRESIYLVISFGFI